MTRNQTTLAVSAPYVGNRFPTWRLSLFGFALGSALLAVAVPASADDDENSSLSIPTVSECSSRYPLVASPQPRDSGGDMEQIIEASYSAEKNWGLDKNVSLLSAAQSDLGEPAFRVAYP